jgi:hypothetical protein
MENFDKAYKPQIEKKKKKERERKEKTLIIFVSDTRYKYYALTKPTLYWYQVTNVLCLFLIITKCGCSSLLPIH